MSAVSCMDSCYSDLVNALKFYPMFKLKLIKQALVRCMTLFLVVVVVVVVSSPGVSTLKGPRTTV